MILHFEYVVNYLKRSKLDDNFYSVDERLASGWYEYSGQRMIYLKSLIK